MRLSILAAGGLAALATATGALAQSWELPPTYGTVELSSGFTPDPHSVQLQAGGDIDAAPLGAGCAGLVADAPDYDLVYEAGGFDLTIYVRSGADTTLVVNGPDGSWHCSDDADGLDPAITFANPASGLYDIWVGSFGGLEDATLHISELGIQ